MADYNLVDPSQGWEYDLHSVYAAYIGYFQHQGIGWWAKSWGSWFSSFEAFLQFGWPVIVITNVYPPHDAHIVTTGKHIRTFLKMIRTRFGEELPLVPQITKVQPSESRGRPMRHIDDSSGYKKLHSSLSVAALTAMKERIRQGDPLSIEELWNAKDKNFLAVDFEWSEKNSATCLEFGYAALRARHVAISGKWPPNPEANYRLGHFIVAEHLDVIVNRRFPTYPRSYIFGKSQTVPRKQLSGIIQAIIDSLASPESEHLANTLVIVAHGVAGDLDRLAELKIRIPSNALVVDTTAFERQLFRMGERPAASLDPNTALSRQLGSTLSLANLLRSLRIDTSQIVFHNAGNDAYAALLSLQLLLEPDTQLKNIKRLNDSEHPPPILHRSMSAPAVAEHPPLMGSIPIAFGPIVEEPTSAEKIEVAAEMVPSTSPMSPVQLRSPINQDKALPIPTKATTPAVASPTSPTTPTPAPATDVTPRSQPAARGKRKPVKKGAQQVRDTKVESAMKNLEL